MKAAKTISPQEARELFDTHGQSISAWARQHGFTASLVYEVLKGRKKCNRGKSHRIAVLLGIKQGELAPMPTRAGMSSRRAA